MEEVERIIIDNCAKITSIGPGLQIQIHNYIRFVSCLGAQTGVNFSFKTRHVFVIKGKVTCYSESLARVSN